MVGEEGEGRQKSCPAPSQDFRLPVKNEDNEKIIKYLTEKREIEKKLVEEWIDRGDIYEEKKHHNVIFVGRDADGIPRYAHCRGTGEIKYRGDVAGSDKSYGFSYRGTDNQLFVFEAAIDWDTRPCLTIIKQYVKTKEPPCTERYARWCERSANQLMISFLLDCYSTKNGNYKDLILYYGCVL